MDSSEKKLFVHGGLNESMLSSEISITYTYKNKDLTKLVKETDRSTKQAIKKLICVSTVCILFMIAEVIGGYLANSLSIMTDAAHMFSDLCGFGISMASLFITKKEATRQMSFGYHRAEVIGASLSVLLIWGLTIWLLAEAVQRFINPEEVDGLIMLIVAGAGLLSNIVMGKILHSHGGHSDDHRVLTHVMLHPEDAPRLTSLGRAESIRRATLRRQSKKGRKEISDDHEHHDHEHHDHEHHDHEHHDHDHEHHDHEHHDHEHHDHSHGHHDHEHHDHSHGHHDHSKGKKEHKHDHGHSHGHSHGHGHGHSHFGHSHHGHNHENMNIRAALIHVIGDLCQSIGVTIAGLIIFLKPDLHIIDPICTLLFSVIVFLTTVPIIRDCVKIIMEGTPSEINIEDLIEELKEAEGVVEVHDLHVWTLSMGKYALSAHIISKNPEISLIACTQICQETYEIKHVTLQMEKINTSYDLQCSVGLHSKYID